MRRLLGYLRPHKVVCGLGALLALIGDAVFQLAPPYLVKVAIDQYIAQGDLVGAERHRVHLSGRPRRVVLARVRADLHDADDRPAHHVRHADADLQPSAAARPVVLRSQSRRPPDDARDHRCGRHQRSVHLRRCRRIRRPVHARRHHGDAAVDGLAAGADHLFGAAAHPGARAMVPAQRAGVVPKSAPADRAHQRLSQRAHQRDGHRAAVPARAA